MHGDGVPPGAARECDAAAVAAHDLYAERLLYVMPNTACNA
jgi:hypothetical protein